MNDEVMAEGVRITINKCCGMERETFSQDKEKRERGRKKEGEQQKK